jgi:hypothetical protein
VNRPYRARQQQHDWGEFPLLRNSLNACFKEFRQEKYLKKLRNVGVKLQEKVRKYYSSVENTLYRTFTV